MARKKTQVVWYHIYDGKGQEENAMAQLIMNPLRLKKKKKKTLIPVLQLNKTLLHCWPRGRGWWIMRVGCRHRGDICSGIRARLGLRWIDWRQGYWRGLLCLLRLVLGCRWEIVRLDRSRPCRLLLKSRLPAYRHGRRFCILRVLRVLLVSRCLHRVRSRLLFWCTGNWCKWRPAGLGVLILRIPVLHYRRRLVWHFRLRSGIIVLPRSCRCRVILCRCCLSWIGGMNVVGRWWRSNRRVVCVAIPGNRLGGWRICAWSYGATATIGAIPLPLRLPVRHTRGRRHLGSRLPIVKGFHSCLPIGCSSRRSGHRRIHVGILSLGLTPISQRML